MEKNRNFRVKAHVSRPSLFLMAMYYHGNTVNSKWVTVPVTREWRETCEWGEINSVDEEEFYKKIREKSLLKLISGDFEISMTEMKKILKMKRIN